MLMKVQMKPCFLFNVSKEQSVVVNYREKYNQIDMLLQNNPGILNAFHDDIKDYGSDDGRESHYSSEQILRMIIIQILEAHDYRSLVIPYFPRIGKRVFSNYFSRFCRTLPV